MKNFYVFQGNSTKLTDCVFEIALHYLNKFKQNRTTISYS